jgi:tRNA(fMet)-specific endonuclease VapC
MILLDSDHVSVLLDQRDAHRQALLRRLESAAEDRCLPLVVVEEQLRAWLAEIRRRQEVHRQIVPYLRLLKSLDFLLGWTMIEWNEPAADHFVRLRESHLRIGAQDLKIACTALAHDALLLSANLRDFEQVPGLRVEDWPK